MSNLIIQEFQGKNVRFEVAPDGKVWGCLTDMVKSTGKRIDNYLTMEGTTELVKILQEQKQSEVLQTRKGRTGGTWAVEEIVLDFGYWSNLEFRLWVIGVIQKLRSTGVVMTANVTEDAVIKEWETQGKELEDLKRQLDFVQRERNALKSWSPNMPMHKIRFLEIINYKGDEYSPFLQRNGFKPIEFQREEEYEQHQKDMRDQRMVLDLIDTLFNGEKLQFTAYGYNEATWDKCFEKLKKRLPVKLYRVLVNQYQDFKKQEHPRPAKQYEQFQFSVELKHERSKVWLEYVPEKEDMLKSYLFESDRQLVG